MLLLVQHKDYAPPPSTDSLAPLKVMLNIIWEMLTHLALDTTSKIASSWKNT